MPFMYSSRGDLSTLGALMDDSRRPGSNLGGFHHIAHKLPGRRKTLRGYAYRPRIIKLRDGTKIAEFRDRRYLMTKEGWRRVAQVGADVWSGRKEIKRMVKLYGAGKVQ